MSKKVLLAGESWMSYTTHVKDLTVFIPLYMRQEKSG